MSNYISFAMFITRKSDTIGSAGVNVEITNPAHIAYAGAAVVGGTVVVGSVTVTAVAAPGLVLIPGAVAAGLCAYGAHVSNQRAADADAKSAPVATTETAAA